jgi:hypothetical protein
VGSTTSLSVIPPARTSHRPSRANVGLPPKVCALELEPRVVLAGFQ